MNKILLGVLVFFSLSLFSQPAHSGDYEEAVGAHVLRETLAGRGMKHEEIMANELKRIAHRHTIEILGIMSEHLPHILKGIQSELRMKADEEYKCSLMENTRYPCKW